jgi:hypothetical protein
MVPDSLAATDLNGHIMKMRKQHKHASPYGTEKYADGNLFSAVYHPPCKNIKIIKSFLKSVTALYVLFYSAIIRCTEILGELMCLLCYCNQLFSI